MEARVGWIVALTSPVVKPSGIWKMVMMAIMMGMMIMTYGNDGDDGGNDQQMVSVLTWGSCIAKPHWERLGRFSFLIKHP